MRAIVKMSPIPLAFAVFALASGCGEDGEEGDKAAPAPPADRTTEDRTAPDRAEDRPAVGPSRPVTFAELETLPLRATREEVVRRVGPPERRERVKPAGVAISCFRYRSVNETTQKPDPNVDFRICYDRAGKLSVKATAPRE